VRQTRSTLNNSFVPGATRHTKAIERNVPDKLVPVSKLQIVADIARDAGATKQVSDFISARLGRSAEFADDDSAVVDMMNDPGLDPIEANESKAAHDLLRWEKRSQALFIAKAILESQDYRIWPNERRKHLRKPIIGSCLETDEHKIAGANSLWRFCTSRPNVEIAFKAVDGNSVLPDSLVIRAQQEVRLFTETAKLRAIETA
jgi:hypothetical protein